MIKTITEDIIILLLLAVAVYFLWTRWIKDKLLGGLNAAGAAISSYVEDVKTVSNPAEVLSALWQGATAKDYQPPQYFADIRAQIDADLAAGTYDAAKYKNIMRI